MVKVSYGSLRYKTKYGLDKLTCEHVIVSPCDLPCPSAVLLTDEWWVDDSDAITVASFYLSFCLDVFKIPKL